MIINIFPPCPVKMQVEEVRSTVNSSVLVPYGLLNLHKVTCAPWNEWCFAVQLLWSVLFGLDFSA